MLAISDIVEIVTYGVPADIKGHPLYL